MPTPNLTPTAQQAHKKGYQYVGHGYWADKTGQTVAKTVNGQLVPLQPHEVPKQKQKSAPKSIDKKDMEADVIMGTKTAGPAGTNPGGFYTGTDGKQRYVKFYKEPSKAYAEHLANSIYKDLGIPAPDSHVFAYDGTTAYASDIIDHEEDLLNLHKTSRKDIANKFMDGFVADVLLANWDVADGLDSSNVIVKNGVPIRIDNGGSLIFRAQAGRKPVELLNDIPEWTGFADPYVNGIYADMMNDAGYNGPEDMMPRIKKQVLNLLKLVKSSGGWDKYVEKHAPKMNSNDKAQIIKMLNSRTKKLVQKVNGTNDSYLD